MWPTWWGYFEYYIFTSIIIYRKSGNQEHVYPYATVCPWWTGKCHCASKRHAVYSRAWLWRKGTDLDLKGPLWWAGEPHTCWPTTKTAFKYFLRIKTILVKVRIAIDLLLSYFVICIHLSTKESNNFKAVTVNTCSNCQLCRTLVVWTRWVHHHPTCKWTRQRLRVRAGDMKTECVWVSWLPVLSRAACCCSLPASHQYLHKHYTVYITAKN